MNDLRRKIRMWKFYEMNEVTTIKINVSDVYLDQQQPRQHHMNNMEETNTLKITENEMVYYIAEYPLLKKPT